MSVQMGMACDEAELQEWHPTNSLVGLARHLVLPHASSRASPVACSHINTRLYLSLSLSLMHMTSSMCSSISP